VAARYSSSSSSSFATSSLLIGFGGLLTDTYVAGKPVDHVTNMAAGWRQVLRRYVDEHFRSRSAADKIFDVIAHNYDHWDKHPGAFLGRERVAGQEVVGDDGAGSRKSREIAGELFADCQISAPTIRAAKHHSTCSTPGQPQRRRTYLYYFNETGLSHDLLTYLFGAPLSPGIDPFHSGPYSDADRRTAVDVMKRWANFIYSGQVNEKRCLLVYENLYSPHIIAKCYKIVMEQLKNKSKKCSGKFNANISVTKAHYGLSHVK